MALNDPVSNMMSNMLNAEKIGDKVCYAKPVSKLMAKILDILKHAHYVGSYEIKEDGRGKIIMINLLGRINKCCAIKPRYPVSKDSYEKFEKRFLPAKGFGVIIVSTSKGVMTHEEAKQKKIGGRLLAYCY